MRIFQRLLTPVTILLISTNLPELEALSGNFTLIQHNIYQRYQRYRSHPKKGVGTYIRRFLVYNFFAGFQPSYVTLSTQYMSLLFLWVSFREENMVDSFFINNCQNKQSLRNLVICFFRNHRNLQYITRKVT